MTGFESVWLKLDRAKQHIDDLEAEVIAFHRTDPYYLIAEDNPQTGQRTAKIGREPTPIPDAVPLILGDAVHALRSSLDHFAFAAVTNPPNISKVAFPIWRKPTVPTIVELQALVNGQVPNASKQLLQALCALEPYKGGNGEQFWSLDYLDLIDKHRLLVTIGAAYGSFVYDAAAEIRGKADWTKDLPPMPINIRPAPSVSGAERHRTPDCQPRLL